MKYNLFAKLVDKVQLKDDVFKFSMEAKEIVKIANPGQFIEIKVNDQVEPFLRRPISIYNLDKKNGILEVIFQVKGKGTKILSEKQIGDLIDIIGPLGNGCFNYSKYNNLAIIGGGIGIFPLHQLAKMAKEDGKNVNTYIGFRNKDLVMLEEEYNKVSTDFCLATDDGSYGKNGFAINFLKEDLKEKKIDCIYACGPLPMLRAVKELAIKENIDCQVSLEEKMGCGIGVCLGCSVKISSSSADLPKYVGVCREGPVFDANYVDF